jgi:nucleoside-diphosphate-sugar epimerase
MGEEVYVAPRDLADLPSNKQLGHIIYAIGMTANFRGRPFDTVEAHVGILSEILRSSSFDSLLYLSSTRVYQNADAGVESTPAVIEPTKSSSIYNISKLLGESLCGIAGSGTTRVARLSNVYGAGMPVENFLHVICRSALDSGVIRLASALDSAKDYVAVDDAVSLLCHIAKRGQHSVYNVAAGHSTSHHRILELMREQIDFDVEVEEGATLQKFPAVNIDLARAEFGYEPTTIDTGFGVYLRSLLS